MVLFLSYFRPNVAQAAQDMQRNNPELFEQMQQQAAQFAQGGGAQPPPGPSDSSSAGSKGSEPDKKE